MMNSPRGKKLGSRDAGILRSGGSEYSALGAGKIPSLFGSTGGVSAEGSANPPVKRSPPGNDTGDKTTNKADIFGFKKTKSQSKSGNIQDQLLSMQLKDLEELKRKEAAARAAIGRARRGRASLIRNVGGERGLAGGGGLAAPQY